MKTQLSKYFDIAVYSLPVIIILVLLAPYIYADMRITNNAIQVYWKLTNEEYSEQQSIRICTRMESGYTKLQIDLDELANLIRLDPVTNGVFAEKINIKKLKALTQWTNTPVWREIDFNSISQCNDCELKQSADELTVFPTGPDPWFELPHINSETYSAIEIESAVSSRRVFPWRWIKGFFRSNNIMNRKRTCELDES